VSATEWWGEALRSWAIPEEIMSAAPDSPYSLPVECFRPDSTRSVDDSPTFARAAEALPDGGRVLDVGVGGGGASLPLAPRAGLVTGVDESADALEGFLRSAAAGGVAARATRGSWPDISPEVEPADVVVCSHVLYNVQDLEPFVSALDSHAVRRVVVEITGRHPLAWMNDLWLHFHGLVRPGSPTADDAVAVLVEMGIHSARQDHFERRGKLWQNREDAVALARRRLCLPATADPELEKMLGKRLSRHRGSWSAGPPAQDLVTLWWDRG